MNLALVSNGFSQVYRQISSFQKSPDSDSSSSSDESVQSADSIASSQTSVSSQESWSIDVESDQHEPVGKPLCSLADRWTTPSSTEYVQSRSLQNPRRTSREGPPPPSLTRQHERKGQFVYHLVDSATYLVETIWPTSAPVCHSGAPQFQQGTLPLRTFIEETLRRSKTSFSTLQVALFYLILLKEHIPGYNFTMEQAKDCPLDRALQCGRRMFLSALILGSKYLQDRNYSARAWSKISGLRVCEININERALLAAVNWKLHIPEPTFNCWQDILVKYSHPSMVGDWRQAIHRITPDFIANYRSTVTAPEANTTPKFWASQQSYLIRHDAASQGGFNAIPVATANGRDDGSHTALPTVAPSVFKLATPSPLSSFCPTPAASIASDMLRGACRPRAMCSAMSMACSAASVRSCVDLPPSTIGLTGAPGQFTRRSSLASTTSRSSSGDYVSPSISSSPASMVSDRGSSRSSSVSSTSLQSQTSSPVRNYLPRLATRNAMHHIVDSSAAAATVSYDDCVTVLDSEPLTGHNFTESPEVIIIEDDSTPIQRTYGSIESPFDSSRESRKRHRNSVDITASSESLQESVRKLVRQKPAPEIRPMPTFYKKNSFGSGKPAAKKLCSMTEVHGHNGFVRPEGGPGMWKHIL